MSVKSGKSGESKKNGGAKMEMNVEKIITRTLINQVMQNMHMIQYNFSETPDELAKKQ